MQRQNGFALLELTIAVAIACMLAIWAGDRLLRDVDSTAERAAGRWMLDLRQALDGMLARHGDTLGAGRAPADEHGRPLYVDPWAPTPDELKAQGHLSSAFSDPGPLGMHAVIALWRDKACPGTACRVDALAYSVIPAKPGETIPGARDLSRLAGIVMATEGAAGSVSPLAPDRLRGAAFDLPNPPVPGMARLPIGTVAVQAGRQAGNAGLYLQQRDARNPQFQGDVSAVGTLSTGGRLATGEHLKLGAIAVAGDLCPENGLLARDADGGLLSCVSGSWSPPGGFGGAYLSNTGTGCGIAKHSSPNPRTGKCSCPPGFQAALVAETGGIYDDIGWTRGYVCVR